MGLNVQIFKKINVIILSTARCLNIHIIIPLNIMNSTESIGHLLPITNHRGAQILNYKLSIHSKIFLVLYKRGKIILCPGCYNL